MAINRKRFLVVFMVANLLFIGVIAGVMAADVALGVPLAGVGGFTVTFDELRGEGLEQNPTIGETDDCPAFPAAMTQMDQAEVDNLHLYRDFDLPDIAPGDADTFRMNIQADGGEYSGLTQVFTSMDADRLTFPQGQEIHHHGTTGDPDDQFSISADEVVIEGGVIHAQSQFTESISLSGSSISLETDPDETHDVADMDCPNVEDKSEREE